VKDTDELLEILQKKRTFRSRAKLKVQDISVGWRNHDQ
jgi:hypothetical protein